VKGAKGTDRKIRAVDNPLEMALRRTRPPQGRLPFEYEVVPDTGSVTAYGGLPLVIDVLRSHGMEESVRKHIRIRERDSVHMEVSVIEDLVLLNAIGGDCLEDLKGIGADKGLCRLLERSMASPETARKFLYEFHDDALIEKAKAALVEGEVAYVPEENEALRGLGLVVRDFIRAVALRRTAIEATLDLDATIQESHKQEAKWHYEGGRGYQPEIIVWAEQDLVVADEFRDGNVPAGQDTLRLTKRGFEALPATVTRRRFRGDSACYNEEQLTWLLEHGIEFTVSADMTTNLKEACKRLPESDWTLLETRPNEQVHISEVVHIPGWWAKGKVRPDRYLAIRLTPTQGKLFDEGAGPKYLAVATNRKGTVEELLRWHWEKAGTVEHVHDVVKNELAGGVLPCGRFGANAAWFRLALLTYNVLSALKSEALPPALHNARPKRLRLQVFTLPAIVSMHARQLWARIVDRAAWAMDTVLARRKLWQPCAAAAAA
jgi:hypothetical protein